MLRYLGTVCVLACAFAGCEKKQSADVYHLSRSVSAGERLTMEMVDESTIGLDSYSHIPIDIKDLTKGMILKGEIGPYLGRPFLKDETQLSNLKTEMFKKQ